MKQFLILSAVLLLSAAVLSATPAINGATGTVTMPTTGTIGTGGIVIGLHYITGYPTMAFLIGGGLTDEWDLTGAVEVDGNSEGAPQIDPFLAIGTKYRYFEGSIHSAIGCNIQNASDNDNVLADPTRFSIYNVIGRDALYGDFSLGIGYTFDNESNIDFWMGYSTEILSKVLYFETDFSNFPYRYYWWAWEFANPMRGFVNMAIRLHIGSLLTINLGSLDIMDDNRELYLGGNFRFQI